MPVTKKKRIEEVKLALQEQMAKDSPDESTDEVLDVSIIIIIIFICSLFECLIVKHKARDEMMNVCVCFCCLLVLLPQNLIT